MTERYDTAGTGRRKFIGAAGAAVAVPFAGCLDGNGDDGGDDGADGVSSGDGLDVNAAFFALYDLARNVARETDTVVDLVPVGSHGDDWEPRPRIVENIQDGDVFVYIDGFRRWSDDQAENIGDEVTVIDAGEGVEFIEGDGGRETDPHFWLDPTLAAEAVDSIADGLTEAVPEDADAFEENAEAYKERLNEVDDRFRDELAGRERDTVVMGSHNSFAYWEPAYGIEVVTATGLSPDSDVSARDREEIENLIADEGIEHVAYDMYEGDRVSERIADATGAELVPLSPVEATTEEQLEDGWGYVEHMTEINLPSLKKALGAE